MPQHTTLQAVSLLPECLGVDLASFVETVFDTDVQSSEITDPSDIEDEELAKLTRMEIELRKKAGNEDVKVPSGVFRWMVARDFAERWPEKVRHVKANPWPGLENVWGSPSGGRGESNAKRGEEPVRWQSGPRSRFIRRKKKRTAAERAGRDHPVDGLTGTQKSSGSSANDRKARAPTNVGWHAVPEHRPWQQSLQQNSQTGQPCQSGISTLSGLCLSRSIHASVPGTGAAQTHARKKPLYPAQPSAFLSASNLLHSAPS